MYTSAWMAAEFLACGGRYAAGFCAGGLAEVVFVEAWEDFDPCPENSWLFNQKEKKNSTSKNPEKYRYSKH